MNTQTREATQPVTPSEIDRAYVEWMLRVAPAKRTLLMAFRAGYLAATPVRRT